MSSDMKKLSMEELGKVSGGSDSGWNVLKCPRCQNRDDISYLPEEQAYLCEQCGCKFTVNIVPIN